MLTMLTKLTMLTFFMSAKRGVYIYIKRKNYHRPLWKEKGELPGCSGWPRRYGSGWMVGTLKEERKREKHHNSIKTGD